MLSKRAKKAIIFGSLGGVVGFLLAVFIFATSCTLSLGAGWTGFSISTGSTILTGLIIASLILVTFTILKVKLKIKLVSFFIAVVFFLITCLVSLGGDIRYYPPPGIPDLIMWIGISVSFLVLVLFIILGAKKGLDIAGKEK